MYEDNTATGQKDNNFYCLFDKWEEGGSQS